MDTEARQAAGTLARGIGTALVAAVALAAAPANADDALWSALRSGGLVVMIRHAATEPGLGDPPDFRLGDCATQRNLSPTGRLEAKRLGEGFRARGVAATEVLSSEWCRCRDTAAIAFGGHATWAPLNSFFGDRAIEPARTRAVRERAAKWKGPGNLVLVTHQVNISALAGAFVAPGELVVLKPSGADTLEVLGTIAPERASN